MEWCKGCYRNDNGHCEAFTEPWEGCFAKITDKEKYIKEQKDIINYNKGQNTSGAAIAWRSIRRVMRER
jgi:hypothetical protein